MISYAIHSEVTQITPVTRETSVNLMKFDNDTRTRVFFCSGELAEFIESERVRIFSQKTGTRRTQDDIEAEFTKLCYGIELAYGLGVNDRMRAESVERMMATEAKI